MPAAPEHALYVLDSTWIHAQPAVLGAAVCDADNWRRWWPGLDLVADELRGAEGVRWTVRGVAGAPALRGSAEIWLQPADDGVLVHFFLRLDPVGDHPVPARELDALSRTYRSLSKKAFWSLADRLDPDRFTRHTSTARG